MHKQNQIPMKNSVAGFDSPRANDIFNSKKGIIVSIPGVKDKNGKPKKETINKLDLLNFRGQDEKGIELMIKKYLDIDINTNNGINDLNLLVVEGIDFLRKNGRKVEFNNTFSTKEDVIAFCLSTTNKGVTGFKNCIIAKSILVVNDILSNKHVSNLHLYEEYLVEKLKNRPEFKFYVKNKGFLLYGNRKINFSLHTRSKTEFSAMQKVAKDPKYSSSDLMEDGVGFTFYVENKKDAAIILQYLKDIMYEGSATISNKFFFTVELIEEMDEELNYEFKKSFTIFDADIKESSGKIEEAKLKGGVGVPAPEDMSIEGAVGEKIGTETKVVEYGSKNDDGLNFQPVYGGLKYIEILCRFLQGYVGDYEINYIVDLFFIELDGNLRLKNSLMPEGMKKTRDSYLKELERDLIEENHLQKSNSHRTTNTKDLKEGLMNYYISKLQKVNIEGRDRPFFYTTTREYNLSLIGYRKKMTKYIENENSPPVETRKIKKKKNKKITK